MSYNKLSQMKTLDSHLLSEFLNEINNTYLSNPKQSYEQMKSIFNKINSDNYIIYMKALLLKSKTAWFTSHFKETYSSAHKLYELSRKQDNLYYQAWANNLLGNINLHMNELDKAIICYNYGLNLAKNSNNIESEQDITNRIGEVYLRLNSIDPALDYFKNALNLGKINNLIYGTANSYISLAKINIAKDNIDKALEYIDIATDLYKNNKYYFGEANALFLKASILIDKEDYDHAKEFLITSKKIQDNIGDINGYIKSAVTLVNIYWKKDDLENAKTLALNILTQIPTSQQHANHDKLLHLLSLIYEKEGDYKSSLEYFKLHHQETVNMSNEHIYENLTSIYSQISTDKINHEKEIFRLKNVRLKKRNKELNSLYKSINNIFKIGQDLTSTLNLQDVFTKIYTNLNNIMPASTLGIVLLKKQTNMMEYSLCISDGVQQFYPDKNINTKNSFSALCIQKGINIFVNDYKSEYKNFDNMTSPIPSIPASNSMLYAPLKFNENIMGAISVQSKEKNAYTTNHLNLLNAISSFIAIAISNANQSEKLEKELAKRKNDQKTLKTLNTQLKQMTYIDTLTKIPNRRYFIERLTIELNRSKRTQSPLTIIMIDIDKFKEYNDNYGHINGDACLQKIASILKNSLKRKSDFIARYGGDEFIMILPDTHLIGARIIAENSRKNVAKAKIEHKFSTISEYVSITLGIFSEKIPQDMMIEKLINLADSALYTAKAMGRNQIASNISSLIDLPNIKNQIG